MRNASAGRHLRETLGDEARRVRPPSADLRPLAGPPARAADRAPRRRRAVGQARRLQQRARVRRQQDAQARVPRRRRARAGLRHARLDRRRAVQPHAPGRRRGGAHRAEAACSCRRAGSTGPTSSTTASATSSSAASWAPTCGSTRPSFGIGFKESWEQAIADVEAAGGTPYAIPAGASDHALGGLGFARWAQEVAEQEAELGVFFDTVIVCSVTGSTQAGMVAGLRRPGARAAGDRHRRLGQAGRDARAGGADRARHRGADRGRARAARRRDRSSTTATTPAPTGSRTSTTLEAIRTAARLEGMITDPVYEGKSMAGMIDLVARGEIARGLDRALRPPRRPAGAERLRGGGDVTHRGRAAERGRARRPRRRAAARAVAGGGDRPPRQPRAPEPLGREGRRPPGVERVDGVADDRAVVRVPRGARPRVGQAARLAGAARDQLPARPARAALPDDAAPVRRPAVLPVAHEGPRPGRLLDRLGRHRRDRADLGRARAPLRRRALRRRRSAGARSR